MASVAKLEQSRLAADRQGNLSHDLHSRVLLWIVRGGDGDSTVEAEVADREMTISVPTRPRSNHLGSPAERPRISDAAIDGDERRVARPTATLLGTNCST